jgi:oxygen-dependent protoporphyrinogen oxidase
MSPPAFLKTPLFSTSAKLRLLREPFIKRADADVDESLAAFVERRLGPEILDYAINPFVSGVYAGSPDSLSVRAAFPRLYELERRYGSLIKGAIRGRRERRRRERRGETSRQTARLFSFAGGMQTIVDALSEARHGSVHTGASIREVRRTVGGYEVDVETPDGDGTIRSRALVFAIPAYSFRDISVGFDFPVGAALARIPYPPVSMVFFGYRDVPTDRPLDGFGFLVPAKEHFNILGTIWSSTLFSGRAPEGGVALTTFVGGSRQPERALLPDRELIGAVQADLNKLLGVRRDPDMAMVRLWERAIPQYNVGHLDIIAQIDSFESKMPGFYVIGNFRGGVSIGDCVKQAHAVAARVAGALHA